MPTVHPIDEPNATHRGWTRRRTSSPCPENVNHRLKEIIIMNAKQVLAAVAITLAGSAAMATEATQFNPAPATAVSRADVKADVARALHDGTIARGEATQYDYAPAKAAASTLARSEVRAEARAFARSHAFNSLYVGS
jgi:hypothetical protein